MIDQQLEDRTVARRSAGEDLDRTVVRRTLTVPARRAEPVASPIVPDSALASMALLAALEPDVAERVEADRAGLSRRERLTTWAYAHRWSLLLLAALLVVGGVVHGMNMLHSPDINEDEGTYISQAWAFAQNGALSHYTYWYDHPPLGWILLAGWNALLQPFGVTDVFVAGRIGMLVVHLANIVLLFGIMRRLRLARWATALGVVVFIASPLGMDLHRLTLLDNIGTPFVLLAWFLALSPGRRMAAYAGAAFSLALAVLIKETHAMFIPPVVAHIFFATKANRRYALPVAGALGVLVVGLYPLYAVLKSELLPGSDHVSLWGALWWQLVDRPSSGWILDDTTANGTQFSRWITMDWPLLLGGMAAAIVVIVLYRRALWIALTVPLLWALMFRGGYVPLPFPINLIWPSALVIAIAAHAIMARLLPANTPRDHETGTRWAPWRVAAAALIVALGLWTASAAAVRTYDQTRRFFVQDRVGASENMVNWVAANVGKDEVIVTDNAHWIQLIQRDFNRDNVIWCYKMDTDPEIEARLPNGWRDVDYVISTESVRIMVEEYPRVSDVLENSSPVATFGDDFEVRKVDKPAM